MFNNKGKKIKKSLKGMGIAFFIAFLAVNIRVAILDNDNSGNTLSLGSIELSLFEAVYAAEASGECSNYVVCLDSRATCKITNCSELCTCTKPSSSSCKCVCGAVVVTSSCG